MDISFSVRNVYRYRKFGLEDQSKYPSHIRNVPVPSLFFPLIEDLRLLNSLSESANSLQPFSWSEIVGNEDKRSLNYGFFFNFYCRNGQLLWRQCEVFAFTSVSFITAATVFLMEYLWSYSYINFYPMI